MNQLPEILNIITKRNLDENLRDLVEISDTNNFRLLLIRHNSLMEDFFKGVLTKEVFDTEKIKIWDAILYFVPRLNTDQIKSLAVKFGSNDSKLKMTILYVAASPADAAQLQVGYEFEKITIALESGSQREKYELLQPLMAVTLERFLVVKHRQKPDIIHFSGHGLNQGLVFSTDSNQYKIIPDQVLEEVFKGVSDYASTVVLNACYASSQAKAISKQGIYVIGMNAPIEDPIAVSLSDKFYRALSNGQNVKEAFFHTKTLLLSEFQDQSNVPELWRDGNILTN